MSVKLGTVTIPNIAVYTSNSGLQPKPPSAVEDITDSFSLNIMDGGDSSSVSFNAYTDSNFVFLAGIMSNDTHIAIIMENDDYAPFQVENSIAEISVISKDNGYICNVSSYNEPFGGNKGYWEFDTIDLNEGEYYFFTTYPLY